MKWETFSPQTLKPVLKSNLEFSETEDENEI